MRGYHHQQRGPWHITLALMGAGMIGFGLGLSMAGRIHPGPAVMLGLGGAVLGVVAMAFQRLEVSDEGDRLAVRFGPIHLFGMSIPYAEIESVGPTQTALFCGYGVQGIPGLFLAFTIWGHDAVQVRLKRRRGIWRARTVFIGTDDAEALAEFLRGKIEAAREGKG